MRKSKTGNELESWGIVQDDRGRILGKLYLAECGMLANDLQIIKKFLIEIQKEKLDMPAEPKTQNRANMVFLEGVIKTLKVRDDQSAFVLMDIGGDSKYIALTVFESPELSGTLKRFRVDDSLQIQGFLRAWSQRNGEKWENKTEVRITRIANQPPKRQAVQQAAAEDDIPF